jgi:hypothetical protein
VNESLGHGISFAALPVIGYCTLLPNQINQYLAKVYRLFALPCAAPFGMLFLGMHNDMYIVQYKALGRVLRLNCAFIFHNFYIMRLVKGGMRRKLHPMPTAKRYIAA